LSLRFVLSVFIANKNVNFIFDFLSGGFYDEYDRAGCIKLEKLPTLRVNLLSQNSEFKNKQR
jgi:hypothetical protein